MSYSFVVKAENKSAAKEAVAKHFDEQIVPSQPMHARDRVAVLANADSVIDLLADDETMDVAVSCNGHMSWNGSDDSSDVKITVASISSSASLFIREQASA